MTVDIFLTYQCNRTCYYCLLGDKRKETNCLSVTVLKDRLQELAQIDKVSIYGGEITLLPQSYLFEVIDTVLSYTRDITLVTNLTQYAKIEAIKSSYPFVSLCTSFNYDRQDYKYIQSVIQVSPFEFNVAVVLTPKLMEISPIQLLDKLNTDLPKNVVGIQFLQYIPTVYNRAYKLSNSNFQSYLIELFKNKHLINIPIENFQFNNKNVDSIFISPNGDYMTTIYANDIEYFYVGSLKEIMSIKKDIADSLSECEECLVQELCQAEHLRQHSVTDSCCGMRGFIYESLLKTNRKL